MAEYDLKTVQLPKLNGTLLSVFAAAADNPITRPLLLPGLLENGGIPKLRRKLMDEAPIHQPLIPADIPATGSMSFKEIEKHVSGRPSLTQRRTARDYARAYREGRLTPIEVAEKVLTEIENSERGEIPLNAFRSVNRNDVMRQAQASAERWKNGQPLSLVDGVPVGMKDEIDMLPYPTTVGTRFLGNKPAASDSAVSARLRAAGALLVGKTNMHEIGINPNGSNAHYKRVANPYDLRRDTGGSSSGSAAAVSAGLVPFAVGADGGGSIRIPAALCGVVGLKPTFGRVSERGAAPLCWSVAHLGPIAGSVEDAAVMYALLAGPDPAEINSLRQPEVTLLNWDIPDLRGIRAGIYWPYFRHADPEVVQINEALLEKLVQTGLEVIEIEIPELDDMRIAHAVTILAEMAASMEDYPTHRKDFSPSTQLSLVLGRSMSSRDYLQAQRMRARALDAFSKIFTRVDVILTPASGLPAPLTPAPGKINGWSDLSTDVEVMRYAFPGNLTGLPAIAFPSGYTRDGIPVSMQAMGRHWEEALLLRVAKTAETLVEHRLPACYFNIL